MVNKNQVRQIVNLRQKKWRMGEGLFIAEGVTIIEAFLQSAYELEHLFVLDDGLFPMQKGFARLVTTAELAKLSTRVTPCEALAIFKIPPPQPVHFHQLVVALDRVSDPGNLGTIIRICDWFGLRHLVCSHGTADCYNSKVVQASAGSLARVQVTYLELETFLKDAPVPVYAADMSGESVYAATLPQKAVLVLGNEATGLSESVLKCSAKPLCIPNFSYLHRAESLNVAMAAAIFLSEFKRQWIIV